jgi:histidinol phosphatase-like PHP family hydrolase
MRLGAIIDVCARRGIKRLGITDHISASTDPGILDTARREIASLKRTIDVYLGCEADILAVGRHVVTDEMRSSLDFISVAANHFHTVDSVAQPADESLRTVGRHFVDMFDYACSLDFVDTIVHPMVVMAGTFDPTCLDLLKDEEIIPALQKARDNGIAMEISPRALARDQILFRLRFYSLCRQAGLKFSIGSDAHSLEMVGQVRILAPIIKELGITDEDIWLPNGGK